MSRISRYACTIGILLLGGSDDSFSCVWKGEESMVPLRPALRSTASPQTVLRGTIDPSPSNMFFGAEQRPPGLGGRWQVGG